MAKTRDQLWSEWSELVNLSPGELADWLATRESLKVGYKPDGGESVGHASGRRIVRICRKKRDALDDEDWAHMRKVVGYIRRHLAQGGPAGDRSHSHWRYSLMNWGHDPLKRGF